MPARISVMVGGGGLAKAGGDEDLGDNVGRAMLCGLVLGCRSGLLVGLSRGAELREHVPRSVLNGSKHHACDQTAVIGRESVHSLILERSESSANEDVALGEDVLDA